MKPRTLGSIGLAWSVGLAPALSHVQQVDPPRANPVAAPVGPDAELGQRIDAAVQRQNLGQFWGAVLVAREGKIVLAKGYGVENDDLRPIDADTVFDIGSIAKQFTSAAVLRLEMDGKLSIDDPVSKFFPGLTGEAKARAARITLKQLMSHTSGQPAEGTIQNLDFPDRDEAVRRFFAVRPAAKPGEKFEYNNAGYVVLGAVIEKASGKEFGEYVREAIFKPAGMSQSGFLDGVGVDVKRGAARVVARGSGGAPSSRPMRKGILQDGWGWGFKGCGGVLTTMNDLVKWDRALAGEIVLNAAAKEKLFTVARDGYAFGWMVEDLGEGSTRQHHTGSTRGFRAALSRWPREGYAVAVMTNEQHDPIGIERLVIAELFPEMKAAPKAVLYVTGLKMNEFRCAIFDDGLRVGCGGAGADGSRTLTVVQEDKDQSKTVATVNMTRSVARKLRADVQAAIRAQPNVGARAPVGVGGSIAMKPYEAKEGLVELPDTVQLVVMPRYTGIGLNNQTIVDERVTLVVMDVENGFWPVIVKLDAKAADKLADDLKQ